MKMKDNLLSLLVLVLVVGFCGGFLCFLLNTLLRYLKM